MKIGRNFGCTLSSVKVGWGRELGGDNRVQSSLSGVCYIVLIVYIRDVVFLRATPYGLGASHILSIPNCNTTSYGLTWVRQLGPNLWNFLTDNIRLSQDLRSFKNIIDFAGMQSSLYLLLCSILFQAFCSFSTFCSLKLARVRYIL